MDPKELQANPPSEALLVAEPLDPAADGAPHGVTVGQLIADPALGLDVRLLAGQAGLLRYVRNSRVQKSGLALAGHFHGVETWRIQILGATELSYLDALHPSTRAKACDGFASLQPCAFVVTRGVEPPAELIAACERTDTPLVASTQKSSATINAIHTLLDDRLAPRTRIHGVLVSIFGIGVLLLGRSGIGKSECAMDLVMRGHRLVADDVVECALLPFGIGLGPAPRCVVGAPAPLLANHIEIRGLGILDMKELYGVTSVAARSSIDLVVQLSDSEDAAGIGFDRLGVDEHHHEILGEKIPVVTIPVRPGRDIAAILQIAARNELLKRTGHHAAKAFRDRLEAALLGNSPESKKEGT